MKVEHSEFVAAPIDEVWKAFANPTSFARYGSTAVEVVPEHAGQLPEPNARYRIMVRVGAALVGGDVIITEHREPRELAWSSFTGVSHRVRIRLRPVSGGTSVTLRLSYDAPGVFGSIADFASYPTIWAFIRDLVKSMKHSVEGDLEQSPGKSLVRRAVDELQHAAVLNRAGIIAPMRPDRLVRVAFAARHWGLSPAALIAVGAARHGDRPVLVDDLGELTYAEADRISSAFAEALRLRGVSEGESIALLARNHRGFLLSMAAVAKLGCDLLLLNTGFSGPQIADVCRREQPTAIVYDAEFADLVAAASANRKCVIADQLGGAGQDSLSSLAAAHDGGAPPSPGRAGKITILTSGTTGTPKGASRGATSHGGAPTLEAPAALLERIPLRSGQRVGLAAPAFHAWGLSNLLLCLSLGCTLVLHRKFDASRWLETISAERLDALIVVPVMLSRILELPEQERSAARTASLSVVAASGSALPGDLSNRWMDQFGDNLYNLYGSTEVANATIATPEDLRSAPGTAGRPTLGTTVRLLDDDGVEVRQGEVGRIFVGNSQLFEGYSGGGGKQRIHGLMATGDLGRFDAAGRLFVAGRDDDMIVSGGENVFPKEVEETIAGHPAVVEVAAIGVDDDDFGQRLRAFVVLRSAGAATEDDLKGLVKANLAGYKVPREIVFLEQLPRNATGKVIRRELESR